MGFVWPNGRRPSRRLANALLQAGGSTRKRLPPADLDWPTTRQYPPTPHLCRVRPAGCLPNEWRRGIAGGPLECDVENEIISRGAGWKFLDILGCGHRVRMDPNIADRIRKADASRRNRPEDSRPRRGRCSHWSVPQMRATSARVWLREIPGLMRAAGSQGGTIGVLPGKLRGHPAAACSISIGFPAGGPGG